MKLSEEEIIKDLKNFIAFAQKEENFIYYSEYKFDNELAERVQGLLDLYQKEKEKNKELEKELDICNDCETAQSIAILNSISKDKIKAKIEEYCEKMQKENEHVNCYDYAVYFLQELLEEE